MAVSTALDSGAHHCQSHYCQYLFHRHNLFLFQHFHTAQIQKDKLVSVIELSKYAGKVTPDTQTGNAAVLYRSISEGRISAGTHDHCRVTETEILLPVSCFTAGIRIIADRPRPT